MQLTGQQIYENFHNGPGSQGLGNAAAIMAELQAEDEEIGASIRKAAAKLEEFWEGDAAGAASRGAGPLAVDHEVTAMHARSAQEALSGESSSFDRSKAGVVPVPEMPESPPGPVEIVNDPIAAGTYYQTKTAALEANENNLRVMDSYDIDTSHHRQLTPTQFGNEFEPAFVKSTGPSGSGPSVDASSANGPGIGSAAGPVANTSAGAPGTGGPMSNVSDRELPTDLNPAEFASRLDGDDLGRTTRQSATPIATETPASRSVADSLAARSNAPGSGPGATPPGTRGGIPGAGRPGGQGADRTAGGPGAGRAGGGSPGAGRGGVPGAGQQPGRMTGAQPGAGRIGGGPGAGAAGRGGMSGMGRGGIGPGMMGGGSRGQGSEDEQHQNKYAAKEQLDDGLVREEDEFGERVVDEQTGESVLSPVIGDDPEPPQQPQGGSAPPNPSPAPPVPQVKAVNSAPKPAAPGSTAAPTPLPPAKPGPAGANPDAPVRPQRRQG